jgi:hypothetical protein
VAKLKRRLHSNAPVAETGPALAAGPPGPGPNAGHSSAVARMQAMGELIRTMKSQSAPKEGVAMGGGVIK